MGCEGGHDAEEVTTHSLRDLGVRPVFGVFSKYLNAQETAILVSLVRSVRPVTMIEFGCHAGRTAKVVLDNVPTLACQMSEVSHTPGYDVEDDRFRLLLAPSRSLVSENLEPCDACFIDGDHSIAAVLHDSHLAKALVRPGGIIVWHDFLNPAVEVTWALNCLRDQGWSIDDVDNSWIAFTRI